MKNYILTIKEIKEKVKEFDTYEEAKEFSNNLSNADRETNVNYTYEIVRKEDYIENELINLKKAHREIYDNREDLLKGIVQDLKEFKYYTDLLIKAYQKYGE